MVTLKNNFGVEPDKDSVVMNVSEGSTNDAKSPMSGHPKAILMCRKNSLPFQVRTLILNTPAKIGRSVARARPSSYNGIFDCKVLSRNHAIIWYEYDTGKFMIQDTRSSNGTFVNNQRLSKGGETSAPREFFSRDVVQFGVDVIENQRKGNEESENSDENNHIVRHGCIVATVRLLHPNGKESRCGQSFSTPTPVPQEKICKLELIIHEAQQREERLHDKLEELQLIISKLETACQEALTNRFEETRLLSKIESLEKQTKVMRKVISGANGKCSEKMEGEIQQLLSDIEKVQSVAREIQEKQHRKLLESEQKLVEAQRVASNLELEVIALREQASLTESHLQELVAKCSAYCQTIETLKSTLDAQIDQTHKLEAHVAKLEVERDWDFPGLNIKSICKYMSNESEEALKKTADGPEVVLEWCKGYEDSDKIEEKDFAHEEDKTEWLSKKLENLSGAMCSGLNHISYCLEQLENSLRDVEISKKNIETLSSKKQELTSQLASSKIPIEENEKTENDLDGEKHEIAKPVILTALSNEKISECEAKLKEQDELLIQEKAIEKELEGKCGKLRCELYATIKRCDKLSREPSNLKTVLRNHLKSLEEAAASSRQRIAKLEAERDELIDGQEQKLLDILREKNKTVDVKETQTSPAAALISTSTNTEIVETEAKVVLESAQESVPPVHHKEESSTADENVDLVDSSKDEVPKKGSDKSFQAEDTEGNKLVEDNWENITKLRESDLEVWEKLQKMQGFVTLLPSSSSSPAQVSEMRTLVNLIAEDLVHLLLREKQMSKEKQTLEEKLSKMRAKDISTFGLAIHLRTIILFSVTAVVAFFIYNALL